MTMFTVTFYGSAPDPIKVGDVLEVSGKATVRSIQADLVDITSYGTDEFNYALGDIEVALVSNLIKVTKP